MTKKKPDPTSSSTEAAQQADPSEPRMPSLVRWAAIATIVGTVVAVLGLVPGYSGLLARLRSAPTATPSGEVLASTPDAVQPTDTRQTDEPTRGLTPTETPPPADTPAPDVQHGMWSLSDSFDDGCLSAERWRPEGSGPASTSCLDMAQAGFIEEDGMLKIRASRGDSATSADELHIMATLAMQVQRAEMDVKVYQQQDSAYNAVRLKGVADSHFSFGLRDEGRGHLKARSYETAVGPVSAASEFPFEEVITIGGWLDETSRVVHLYVNEPENEVSTVSAHGGWSAVGFGYYLSPETPSIIEADVLAFRVQYVGAESGGVGTPADDATGLLEGNWIVYDDFSGPSLNTDKWTPTGSVSPDFRDETLHLRLTEEEDRGYSIDVNMDNLRQEQSCPQASGLEATVRLIDVQAKGHMLLHGGDPGTVALYFGGTNLGQAPPPRVVAASDDQFVGGPRSLSTDALHRLRIEWGEDQVLLYADGERLELWQSVPNPGYPGFLKLSFSPQEGDIEVEVDQVRIRCGN